MPRSRSYISMQIAITRSKRSLPYSDLAMNIVMEAGEVGEGFQAWVFLFVGSFSSHTQGSAVTKT